MKRTRIRIVSGANTAKQSLLRSGVAATRSLSPVRRDSDIDIDGDKGGSDGAEETDGKLYTAVICEGGSVGAAYYDANTGELQQPELLPFSWR